ncbi:MAG: hypothetical protein WC750_06595 [Patescibacteria group bacterium]|jgi:hypothetical protein
MAEDRGEIKIRYTLKQGKEYALRSETVHIFPVSPWKIFLILIPTFIVLAFLSAFIFSIFFPLFLFGGIILSLWIWWLRRKLHKSNSAENLVGEYIVTEETRFGTTKTDKAENP